MFALTGVRLRMAQSPTGFTAPSPPTAGNTTELTGLSSLTGDSKDNHAIVPALAAASTGAGTDVASSVGAMIPIALDFAKAANSGFDSSDVDVAGLDTGSEADSVTSSVKRLRAADLQRLNERQAELDREAAQERHDRTMVEMAWQTPLLLQRFLG